MREFRKPVLDRVVKALISQFQAGEHAKEFQLNVEDENGPMLLATSDHIETKYPVVRPLSEL
jgi:hypothetical protein